MPVDARARAAPSAGNSGKPDLAFARMLHVLEQADGGEMRIVDQVIEIVERHAGDVGLAQQREPLGRRPLPEDLAEDRVDLGIVPRSEERRVGKEWRSRW